LKKIQTMTKYFPLFCLLFFVVTACTDLQEHNRQNMQKVAEEMKMREFKKVSETDMMIWVNEEGKKITQSLQTRLKKDLQTMEKTETSPSQILKQYHSPIIDSLAKSYPVEIKQVSFEFLPKEKLHETEQAILEAYLYSLEKKEKLVENYQKMHNETPSKFLFTSPMQINNRYVGMWSLVFSKSSVIKNM